MATAHLMIIAFGPTKCRLTLIVPGYKAEHVCAQVSQNWVGG